MLYLTTNSDTAMAMRNELERLDLKLECPHHDVIAVEVTASQLHLLGRSCVRYFSADSLENTLCHLTDLNHEVTPADLMHTINLGKLFAWASGQWLHGVLQEGNLFTHFQPIVCCKDPRRVFAYECLLRGREANGSLISPLHLFDAARDSGLLDELDRQSRLIAIQSATDFGLDSHVFINFNPRATANPDDCMESSLRAATQSPIDNERFVFELVESDEVKDPDGLTRIVKQCRDAGCRVALDDVAAGYNSLNLIALIKPDFIKLDMGLIRDVDRDPYKSCVAGKLLELARELGAKTVVEGVETADEWQWAAERGADFAQGFLFGRPEAIPEESMFAPTAMVERTPSDLLAIPSHSESN